MNDVPNKNKQRAIRRFHKIRLKAKRKRYWYGDSKPLSDKHLNMVANTPKLNKCSCCSNPRRNNNYKRFSYCGSKETIQELKQDSVEENIKSWNATDEEDAD